MIMVFKIIDIIIYKEKIKCLRYIIYSFIYKEKNKRNKIKYLRDTIK